jgi:hypothetical protein
MNVNARNFIDGVNEENLHEKVGEFLSTITRNHVSSTQTDIMFELWYMVSGIRDNGKSCGKCRGTVYKRLKMWYNDKNKKSK